MPPPCLTFPFLAASASLGRFLMNTSIADTTRPPSLRKEKQTRKTNCKPTNYQFKPYILEHTHPFSQNWPEISEQKALLWAPACLPTSSSPFILSSHFNEKKQCNSLTHFYVFFMCPLKIKSEKMLEANRDCWNRSHQNTLTYYTH